MQAVSFCPVFPIPLRSPVPRPALPEKAKRQKLTTTQKDSNYGSVVDILAPGTSVLSAWIGSNSATNTISGTSMASPHVCGLALYYMSVNGVSTPSGVLSRLQSIGTSGKVGGVPGSTVNRVAFNGAT
jgi:subtilisin family serine protease